MNLTEIQAGDVSDANLVAESLSQNREAFGVIVARYQTLICSLAYSGTGNLSQSEDVAQETFIAAWKQLGTLREPAKLRPWLCRIARNLTWVALRKQGREPVHGAENLEAARETPSRQTLPPEQVISKEEESILWRSLERIPETYREPLILFYREHRSISAVAEELELTEEAVRQRLSRGRNLLHEQVLAFVEGALEKTSPGAAFTSSVVAVLPVMVASAQAATVGAGIAKGGAAATGAMTVGALGSLFVILGSAWVSLRAQADDSKSPRERVSMLRMSGMRITFILLSVVLFFIAMQFRFFRVPIHFDYLAAGVYFYYCVDGVLIGAYQAHRRQQIQMEDKTYVEAEWRLPRAMTDPASDSGGSQQKNSLQMLRLTAFGSISGAMIVALMVAMNVTVNKQGMLKEHKQIFIFSFIFLRVIGASVAIWLVILIALRLLLRSKKRKMALFAGPPGSRRFSLSATNLGSNVPRFTTPLRRGVFWRVPVTLGLATLLMIGFLRLGAFMQHGALRRPDVESPMEFLVFGLVVVLAYTSLIGILARSRRGLMAADSYTVTEIRPGQLKAVTIISQTIRTMINDIDGRRKGMENLRAKLAEAQIKPCGSPISIIQTAGAHFRDPIDIEMGIPVADNTTAPDGCHVRVLESVPGVIGVFRGPLSAVGLGYADLMRQMRRMKKTPTGELRQHGLLYDGPTSSNNIFMLETPDLETPIKSDKL
jgi:RNA polymerase sigma factor (sigma-70 family)